MKEFIAKLATSILSMVETRPYMKRGNQEDSNQTDFEFQRHKDVLDDLVEE